MSIDSLVGLVVVMDIYHNATFFSKKENQNLNNVNKKLRVVGFIVTLVAAYIVGGKAYGQTGWYFEPARGLAAIILTIVTQLVLIGIFHLWNKSK